MLSVLCSKLLHFANQSRLLSNCMRHHCKSHRSDLNVLSHQHNSTQSKVDSSGIRNSDKTKTVGHHKNVPMYLHMYLYTHIKNCNHVDQQQLCHSAMHAAPLAIIAPAHATIKEEKTSFTCYTTPHHTTPSYSTQTHKIIVQITL
uniref:Uncharacterized protein n=1 Tax=Glossina palpalis gambiensis TaxID=67801 RepID=A0A1B0AYZ0_9MUSC